MLTFAADPDPARFCARLSEFTGARLAEGTGAVVRAEEFLVRGDLNGLTPDELAGVGDALCVLLPGEVTRTLSDLDEGGRLRLWVTDDQGLFGGLPWELLRVPVRDGPARFLAREGGVVIRYYPVPGAGAAERSGPLRVLIVSADPRSARYGPLAHAQEETEQVRRLLSEYGDQVAIRELPHATPAALQRVLAEGGADLLYFVGHGDVLPSGGALVLQGERPGEHSLVYGDELCAWVGGSSIRMVVLSSCLAGGPQALGRDLTAAGVPAVLGMQFAVRDESARGFARFFFGSLLRTGDAAEAVATARQAGAGLPDWAAPVLTLSTSRTQLFDPIAPGSVPVGPFHVPYRPSSAFLGREADLECLHAALTRPENVPVALVGLGGIGKTQLAVEYAHRHRGAYPAGVFWVNAHDQARMAEGFASLSRFWKIPESASTQRKAELVRDALQAEKAPCLLILDNVGAGAPLELLPVIGPCRVLLTCRDEEHTPAGRLKLEPQRLSRAESVRLLLRHEAGDDDEEAARSIAELVDGLPLALMLAVHHMRRLEVPMREYCERLRHNRVAVLKEARRRFITDTRHDGNIFDAIDLSCRGVSPEALSVLRAAACFAGRRIEPGLLRRAAGEPPGFEFEECIAELRESCLLSREEGGRLGLHELVRVYSLGCLPEKERAAQVSIAAGVLLELLREANRTFDWRQARPELAHLRAAVELCRENRVPVLGELLEELGSYALQHRDDAAIGYFTEALTLARKEGQEGTPRSISLQMNLAVAKQHAKHYDEARDLALATVVTGRAHLPADDPLLADLYNDLGYVLKMQKRLDEAEPWYRKALELNRALRGPNHPEVASCLNNLGALLEDRRDYEGAIGLYREALAIDEAAFGPNHVKAGIRLNNMGRALNLAGRPAEALDCLTRVLSIHEPGYGRGHIYTALALVQLGHARHALQDFPGAHAAYEEALAILERHYGAEHATCREVRLALDGGNAR